MITLGTLLRCLGSSAVFLRCANIVICSAVAATAPPFHDPEPPFTVPRELYGIWYGIVTWFTVCCRSVFRLGRRLADGGVLEHPKTIELSRRMIT